MYGMAIILFVFAFWVAVVDSGKTWELSRTQLFEYNAL